MLGVMGDLRGLHVHYGQGTLSLIERRHHGVLDPLLIFDRWLETVYDKFYEMGLIAVQGRYLVQFQKFSIHSDLCVSAFAHLLEKLLVMTFSSSDHRCKQITFPAGIVLHY